MAENHIQNESQVGKKYANLLQYAIRQAIQQESASFSTLALRTKVTSRMKKGYLQRLILHTPKHSFVHHYGVETVRAKRGELKLRSRDHLSDLKQISVLNGLATEIGNISAEEVNTTINF